VDTHREQLYQLGELLQTIAENPEPVQEDFEGELDKVEVKVSALLEQVETSIGGGPAMKEQIKELARSLADARKLSREADGVLDEAEVGGEEARRRQRTALAGIRRAQVTLGRAQQQLEVDAKEALRLVEDGLTSFPDADKLWMMKGQLECELGKIDKARQTYTDATKKCPDSIPLWLLFAELECQKGTVTKARSVVEKARLRNPATDQLWLKAIRIEAGAGLVDIAKAVLARALQECPNSGLLWAEAIAMEPTKMRKTKSVDAMKKCEHDPIVLLAVAKLFWADRKVSKAREWLTRTVKLEPDFGDAWIHFYKFELLHGTAEQQEDIKKRCIGAEPKHGALWCQYSKDIKHWQEKTEFFLLFVTHVVTKLHAILN